VSYADTLPLLAEQERQELRAIERERARNAFKMHNTMCRDVRQAMLDEYFERVRLGATAK
jgi:hypothetical protein